MANNKKIAYNTILLYVRMIVVLLINLYTVRIVLKALGDIDYGIYNVVAGVITMFASLSSVFSTATQRYLSFSLGERDFIKLKKIFSASLNIYLVISIVALIIGETLGLWFINTKLVIPPESKLASNWIYQFSMFSFVASMLSAPYLAASIAHEDMGLFAIISSLDAVLKLIFAFSIPYIPIDHLIYYGFYLFLIQLLTFGYYFLICKKRYIECSYCYTKDWLLHKEMLSFSGWTLFSSFASIGVNQVIAILINIFFGPMANASLAIAFQVNSALSTFSNSFIMAIRPPMIKAYAEKQFDYLKRVFFIGNKFTYYCMLIIAVPLILEMPMILHVWLGDVDKLTVIFCKLGVIYSVLISLCNPISIIVQATGKMKQFTVPVEMVTISIPFFVYILFKLNFIAQSAFYVMIILVLIAQIVRLIYLKKVFPEISLRKYSFSFVLPALLVTFITLPVCFIVHNAILNDFIRFSSVCISSLILILLLTLFIGLSNSERRIIKSIVRK